MVLTNKKIIIIHKNAIKSHNIYVNICQLEINM